MSPPPTYRTTSRMSVRIQTPIPFPSEEEVASLFALPTPPPSPLTPLSSPLSQIPSPPTHHPLPLPAQSTSRKADIPEGKLPPRKRLLLTAPIPRFEIGESSTATAARQPRSTVAQQKAMAVVKSVNLRVIYQANIHRCESEEFQTRHQDAQYDHVALCNEVDTLRRYLSSLCTTHKQERVEARQTLDRFEAYIRALEARIAALEAGARIDTLEDTGIFCSPSSYLVWHAKYYGLSPASMESCYVDLSPLDINYKMKHYYVISVLSFLPLNPRVIKKH
ncbi:hypothetical protein Tco_1455281 [Tanacetum coccineum]